MKKMLLSMALPSVLLLHGLGFLLLLAFALNLGPRSELLPTIVFVTSCCVGGYLLKSKQKQAGCTVILDWAVFAFISVLLLSFALQAFNAPWVKANLRNVPFLVILPYLCGRLTTGHDLKWFATMIMVLFGASLGIAILIFLFVEDSQFHYRPIIHGSDEVTARFALLTAYACIITVYFQLTKTTQCLKVVVISLVILVLLVLLLNFLGLRGIVIATVPPMFVACMKAHWVPPTQRWIIAGVYISAIIASYFLFQQAALKDMEGARQISNVISSGAAKRQGA